MATAKFFLREPYKKGTTRAKAKTLNPQETRLLLFIIIDRNQIIKIKTPHMMFPKDWDFKKQLKKETLAGAPEFNERLLEYRAEMLDKYYDTLKKNPDLPFKRIAEIVIELANTKGKPKPDNKDFYEIFDLFKTSMEGEVAPGTIKKFHTLKLSLQEFGVVNPKYANLQFSMIDFNFLDAYKKYLRNQKPRGRQKTRPEELQFGLLNDTIGKYIETLKTFCKWAQERNFNKYSTYAQFSNVEKANLKRKKQKADIVTLSLPELIQFYKHDFSKQPSLDRVRDLFCFGAFTGQRWSDIERLDKLEIHGDIWSFTAYKTKKETDVDLTGYAAPALDILKKYDYQLPKISLTKFNLFIKNAAEAAGINAPTKIMRYVGAKEIPISKPKYKFIGSHTARKTCVSILLNYYNINVTHVLEITGHSDLKTLQKYIDRSREARRDAMSKTTPITEIMTVTHKSEAV